MAPLGAGGCGGDRLGDGPAFRGFGAQGILLRRSGFAVNQFLSAFVVRMCGPQDGRDTPKMKTRNVAKTGWRILASVAVLYLAGFVLFVATLPDPVSNADLARADGIVALTGEDARLVPAVSLLEDGVARRLLISGVFPETTKSDLKELTHGGPRFDCCADLGFHARDTRGNAREAADWARRHRFRSLIVVTASYHMPRSLLEFSAAMPNVKLVAYPIDTDPANPTFLKRWGRMQAEYAKFLASEISLALDGA
jgi:uncharacterized SAM-binding protein YcdF (DUF218 family)